MTTVEHTPTFDTAPTPAATIVDPTKSLEPGKSDTDVIGTVDHGAVAQKQNVEEAAKSKAFLPVYAPSAYNRPIVRLEDDPIYATALLAPASLVGTSYLTYSNYSTYTPNFQSMFSTIRLMDIRMSNTKKWYDNCLGWIPTLSELYFGVLGIVQTFRAMRIARALSPEQNTFLSSFEREFKLSTLQIPGPLVGYFTALSAVRPTTGDVYGHVIPFLPARHGATVARHFVASDELYKCIPNIRMLMDRIQRIVSVHGNNPWDNAHPPSTGNVPNYFAIVPANTPAFQRMLICPGAGHDLVGSARIWENMWSNYDHLNLPPMPEDFAAEIADTWSAYLYMDFSNDTHRWFGSLSSIMALYSKFFNHSQSLADCQVNTSAAGLVKMNHIASSTCYTAPNWVAPVAPALGHYKLRKNTHVIIASASHVFPDLPEFYENQAKIAQLTAIPIGEHAAAYRTGPFWNIHPDVRACKRIDVTAGLQTSIVTKFHSEQIVKEDKASTW